jgi:iron complex outermembrane receptor protein
VQANNGGVFKYPNTNAPFGFNGGYYYAEANWRF